MYHVHYLGTKVIPSGESGICKTEGMPNEPAMVWHGPGGVCCMKNAYDQIFYLLFGFFL